MKKRVKNILNYKKPRKSIVSIGVAVCLSVSVFFIADSTKAVKAENKSETQVKKSYTNELVMNQLSDAYVMKRLSEFMSVKNGKASETKNVESEVDKMEVGIEEEKPIVNEEERQNDDTDNQDYGEEHNQNYYEEANQSDHEVGQEYNENSNIKVEESSSSENISENNRALLRTAVVNSYSGQWMYVDTGEVSNITEEYGTEGYTFKRSKVNGDFYPIPDNEDDHEPVYKGRKGLEDDKIEIYFEGEWHIFEKKQNGIEGVSMQVIESNSHFVTVSLANNTDQEYTYGEDYALERYDEEKHEWVDVSFIGDGIISDVGFLLLGRSTRSWSVDITKFYGELSFGRYRILKQILSPGEPWYCYAAEFEI